MFKLSLLMLAASVTVTFAAPPKTIFEVQLQDFGGSLLCQIHFEDSLPSPTVVDKIVHDSLVTASMVAPTRDIIALAFVGDDSLTSRQYSGKMTYRAADKRIMSEDEARGLKTSVADTGSYFVEIKEDGTYAGIKPERKWLTLSIVFPTRPSDQQALDAALTEIQKHTASGIDINAVPEIGDKKVRTSWQQMTDPKGGFYYFQYKASDRTVSNKSTLIKKL